MVRYVGGQIPTDKHDDTRDAWMGETLNEGFASNHSARANDEDFHGDGNSGVDKRASNVKDDSKFKTCIHCI